MEQQNPGKKYEKPVLRRHGDLKQITFSGDGDNPLGQIRSIPRDEKVPQPIIDIKWNKKRTGHK